MESKGEKSFFKTMESTHLDMVICGDLEDLCVDKWKHQTSYVGCTENDIHISSFWKVNSNLLLEYIDCTTSMTNFQSVMDCILAHCRLSENFQKNKKETCCFSGPQQDFCPQEVSRIWTFVFLSARPTQTLIHV